MVNLSLKIKLFVWIGFLGGGFVSIAHATDEYLIKLTQTSRAKQIEIFSPQSSQEAVYKKTFSNDLLTMGKSELQDFGGLAQVLQQLSYDPKGLTLKGVENKTSGQRLRIESFGSVILDDLYSDHLNLISDAVITKGQTTVLATNEFRVNSLTQESGVLSIGNGKYHVNGLYTIGSGAVLNTLVNMHVHFRDLNNQGEIHSEHLTVNLQRMIQRLGHVKATTVRFHLDNAVDVRVLARNSKLDVSQLFVNGEGRYASLLDYVTQNSTRSQSPPSSQGKSDEKLPDDYVIDFTFPDGKKATFGAGGLRFIGPVCIAAPFSKTPTQIIYQGLTINHQLPIFEVFNQIKQSSAVRNVTLRYVPPTLDTKASRELKKADEKFSEDLSLDEKIEFVRNLLTIALKYSELGAKKAKDTYRPDLQFQLACLLFDKILSKSQASALQRETLINEAFELLEQSVQTDVFFDKRDRLKAWGNCAAILFNAAKTLAERQQIISCFEGAIKHDSLHSEHRRFSDACCGFGVEFFNQAPTRADQEKGIAYLEKALHYNPFSNARKNLAGAYCTLGANQFNQAQTREEEAKSIADFEKALEYDPSHSKTRTNLKKVKLSLGMISQQDYEWSQKFGF